MWSCVVFTCHPPVSSICTLLYVLSFAGCDIWFQARRWVRKFLEWFFFYILVLTVLFILHTVTCSQVKIRMIMKNDATGHTQIIWFYFKQYTSDTFWLTQISAAFYLWAHRWKYLCPLQREVFTIYVAGIWRKPLLKVALNNVIPLKCYSRDKWCSEHVPFSDELWFFGVF